jgi:ATP sulfurylase
MVKETPKILLKALRQYAHNTRVGDLFAGFDYDETVKIVESLAKEIERLKLRELIYCESCGGYKTWQMLDGDILCEANHLVNSFKAKGK